MLYLLTHFGSLAIMVNHKFCQFTDFLFQNGNIVALAFFFGIVAQFGIHLVITIIMIYRNTADVKDNLYDALDELDERYAAFEAQNRELKAQNKELLEKLNRIEAMLNAAEKPEAENTEEH